MSQNLQRLAFFNEHILHELSNSKTSLNFKMLLVVAQASIIMMHYIQKSICD